MSIVTIGISRLSIGIKPCERIHLLRCLPIMERVVKWKNVYEAITSSLLVTNNQIVYCI